MDCRECGNRLEAGASFCHICGAPVAAEARSSAPVGTGQAGTEGSGTDRPADTTASEDAPGGEGGSATTRQVDPVEDTDPNPPPPLATSGGGDLVGCVRCGATNSGERLICGRCGADLETGEPGRMPEPRLEESAEPAAEPQVTRTEVDDDTGDRRLMLYAVLGAAVLAGGIIGGVVLTGGLGFGGGLPDPPEFSEPAQLLVASEAVASSTAEGTATSGLIADGDISTAWRARRGATTGEILELALDEPAWIRELQFAVGDQSDEQAFGALARPTRVRVRFGEQKPVIAELLDQPGVQRVPLDPARRATQLRIEILETAPGDNQDTVAVSEVALRGHPADRA